ncbi:glycosyltransferase [Pseudorhodoplanes sp.]|uniref:glycosyltransferase n=1 Tax=Pseudorhodoplanes sp. TaxID=1934341 RepID=UPI00391B417A
MISIAAISLAIWIFCVFLRGGYWRADVLGDDALPPPAAWPHIVAIVPARNEAESIADSLTSLLIQDYPGRFSVVLVDDNSEDATASIAQALPQRTGSSVPLTVLRGQPLAEGWTGKLWALQQGIAEAGKAAPDYLLLTDADIVYEPGALRNLAARAVSGRYVLTSLMVKLRCESLAERAFIPAFVYFFQMLYPFAWVNDPRSRTAAAAGGCMLVKADALARAGGIAVIREALIDDCSLARVMKARGPIWLGLTRRVRSIRASDAFGDIHTMVSRSAFAQLRYSPVLLALTLVGMALTYWAPPLIALFGHGTARALALAAWALMAVSFWPILRFYGLSPLWAPALPVIATGYMAFTFSSALQHMLGRGGRWKGRYQAKKP